MAIPLAMLTCHAELVTSDEMSNLAILSIKISSSNFNFDKPESMVRAKRDTCRAVARCWQREVADRPCCGNMSNLPCCGTRLIELEFSKPEIAIWPSCDSARYKL